MITNNEISDMTPEQGVEYIEKVLVNLDLFSLKVVSRMLGTQYNCEFPKFKQGMSEEQFRDIILDEIIYRTNRARENGTVLDLTNKALEQAEAILPGLQKHIPWYVRLFKPTKN